MSRFIDIHTHHPTGLHRELRAEGRHPWQADSDEEIFISSEAEAIGEIGFDYVCSVNRDKQETVFRQQLEEAQRRNIPVVLHCVRAFEPMMKILANYTLRAVIFHGFIGSAEQAQRAFGKGYYLSFGDRCAKSPKTIKALQVTPLDRIFAETDESTVSIEQIYHLIASLRGIRVEELTDAIEQNYNRIFRENEQ